MRLQTPDLRKTGRAYLQAIVRASWYGAMAETPAVFRKRDRAAQVEALANSGVEKYDIPAFLRKQAD